MFVLYIVQLFLKLSLLVPPQRNHHVCLVRVLRITRTPVFPLDLLQFFSILTKNVTFHLSGMPRV